MVMHGHASGVNMLAYNPDGRLLASVSDDNTCAIWEDIDSNNKWLKVGVKGRIYGRCMCAVFLLVWRHQ